MLLTGVPTANGTIITARPSAILLVGNVIGIIQIVLYLNARILTTTIIMVHVSVVLAVLVSIVRKFAVLRVVLRAPKFNIGMEIAILPTRLVLGISMTVTIMMVARLAITKITGARQGIVF